MEKRKEGFDNNHEKVADPFNDVGHERCESFVARCRRIVSKDDQHLVHGRHAFHGAVRLQRVLNILNVVRKALPSELEHLSAPAILVAPLFDGGEAPRGPGTLRGLHRGISARWIQIPRGTL